jgi:hypothetical protein
VRVSRPALTRRTTLRATWIVTSSERSGYRSGVAVVRHLGCRDPRGSALISSAIGASENRTPQRTAHAEREREDDEVDAGVADPVERLRSDQHESRSQDGSGGDAANPAQQREHGALEKIDRGKFVRWPESAYEVRLAHDATVGAIDARTVTLGPPIEGPGAFSPRPPGEWQRVGSAGVVAPRLATPPPRAFHPIDVARTEGIVKFEAVVGVDGRVGDVAIAQSLHPDIDESIVATTRKSRLFRGPGTECRCRSSWSSSSPSRRDRRGRTATRAVRSARSRRRRWRGARR